MSLSRLLRPVDYLVAALSDPARRARAVLGVLVGYVAIWTLYGAFAKASQDIHFDMAELVAWSRELAFGYSKHPPLAAWLVRGWFMLFPAVDWAYYLLAMTVVAVALWIAWRLSERFLDGEALSQVVGEVSSTKFGFVVQDFAVKRVAHRVDIGS